MIINNMGKLIQDKKCSKCGEIYIIHEEDIVFFDMINVPLPSFCPECRRQRRLSFRNERHLYKRTCDFSKKNIISNISPDKPYKVYESEIWHSDKWNPMEYGRNYDFSRSFFVQYFDLFKDVPQIALIVSNCENCNYTNYSWENNDCYLIFDAGRSEKSLYCQTLYSSSYVIDSSYIRNSVELCADSINCSKCYNIKSCRQCYNSTDLAFCYDLRSSRNCFLCSNLRNKDYCFMNNQLTKEEYEETMSKINLGNRQIYDETKVKFENLIKQSIHPESILINSSDCTGNFIGNSKSCINSFNVESSEDCKYLYDSADPGNKNCYDDDRSGWGGEMCYETVGLPTPYNTHFSISCGYPKNLDYCYFCNNCVDCFGCVSLKKKQYCILNKQYTKDEYLKLRDMIIEAMKSYGEWGEFFPTQFSPFAYNETLAFDQFPLSKEEVVASGYKWKEVDNRDYVNQTYDIPNDIANVKDDILHEILSCKLCKKNYRIVSQELKLLRDMNLPIPIWCPECRNQERNSKMNPMKLFDRNCHNCNAKILTSYSPDRGERVYCNNCYIKEVY